MFINHKLGQKASFIATIWVAATVAFLLTAVFSVYYMLRPLKSSMTETGIPHPDGHGQDDIQILMQPEEVALFTRYVIACSNSAHCEYLEWGTGGSTQFVSKLMHTSPSNHINSIEHAAEWCDKMENNALVRTAILTKTADFHCVDTGVELGHIGYPVKTDNATLDKMQVYINYVDKIEKKTSAQYLDLVLIDGRFRVACALKLILANHIDRNSVVMLHDYTDEWRQYSIVERYYDKIGITSTLAVLRQKSVIDYDRLQQDFDRFRYVTK